MQSNLRKESQQVLVISRHRTWIFLLILTLSLSRTDTMSAEQRMLKNPVAPNGADPWVIQKNDDYYYCYSFWGSICVNKARRIVKAVQPEGKAVWSPEPGQPWSREIWAPELHFLEGKWYIYFAADDGNNENHRMYVLESETVSATDEYVFRGKLRTPSDKWAIDGTVMEHEEQLYFIWSGWEGDVNVQQNLYIAKMKDPLTIIGERVLISKPEHDWEKFGRPLVNEGPEVLKHDGDVFIIYSASGSWTDHYCLGQLKLAGNDPTNPNSWEKKSTPVFSPTATVFGPGHASFTMSPDGTEDWIIYHAAKHSGSGWDRNVRMQKFTWDEEGNPVFGEPIPESVEFPAPSE